MITENLSTLKIHKLTQAQYDRELAAGNIDGNALYLTPDEEIASIEKGGTGATTAEAARANLGAVNKAGDSMSGKLDVTGGVNVVGTSWNYYGFKSSDDKTDSDRGSVMISNNNRIHINQRKTGASYQERYNMPELASELTADKWYEILTTKKAVSISQGGTGATTAAGALTNLGALPKTGGTITGNLGVSKSTETVARLSAENSLRKGSLEVSAIGNFGLYDLTNSSWVIKSDVNQNVIFSNPIVLESSHFGTKLPAAGTSGRIFFKKASG